MLEKRGRANPGESTLNSDHNQLNVAHVCMGLAFELVLKALAVSEGRRFKVKHDALTNYRALSQASQDKVAQAISTHTGMPVEDYLNYLDERMCHPDRKYWMVGRSGAAGGTGFSNIPAHSIPVAAKVRREIADPLGQNTFRNWQQGQRIIV